MDFSNVTDWHIPNGNAIRVKDQQGRIIWQKKWPITYKLGGKGTNHPNNPKYAVYQQTVTPLPPTPNAGNTFLSWSPTSDKCDIDNFSLSFIANWANAAGRLIGIKGNWVIASKTLFKDTPNNSLHAQQLCDCMLKYDVKQFNANHPGLQQFANLVYPVPEGKTIAHIDIDCSEWSTHAETTKAANRPINPNFQYPNSYYAVIVLTEDDNGNLVPRGGKKSGSSYVYDDSEAFKLNVSSTLPTKTHIVLDIPNVKRNVYLFLTNSEGDGWPWTCVQFAGKFSPLVEPSYLYASGEYLVDSTHELGSFNNADKSNAEKLMCVIPMVKGTVTFN